MILDILNGESNEILTLLKEHAQVVNDPQLIIHPWLLNYSNTYPIFDLKECK